MTVTVVGSVAFDSLQTPSGRRDRILGGAATHFSLSASMFTDVRVVGVVGDDFGEDELRRFHDKGIDTTDLERVSGARSFFWEGRYEDDMQVATTIDTQLNVFADFDPKLSGGSREASTVFLANIQPDLQRAVREQCGGARITGLDSMNYWIESARESLLETLAVVDVVMLNDVEVRMLTGEPNLKAAAAKMRAHGPRVLVIKQGSYGACMCSDEGFFFVPGMPLDTIVDPTGAGDAFAGGFFGYLDSHASDPFDGDSLRRAAVYGSVMASFAIEDFGSDCLERVTHAEVVERCREFHRLTDFEHRAARERVLTG
jgi:sugar/nucleoside kinase (ribokinase family)